MRKTIVKLSTDNKTNEQINREFTRVYTKEIIERNLRKQITRESLELHMQTKQATEVIATASHVYKSVVIFFVSPVVRVQRVLNVSKISYQI